jgi:hypothetical protein
VGHVKRVLKHPETKVGFSPLAAESDELSKLLEQAIATRARADLAGIGTQLRILDGSTEQSIEFSLPDPTPSVPPELCAIIFLTRSTLLCLQSSAIGVQENRLKLKTPFRAFTLQRRGGVRVELTGAYEYLAELTTSSVSLVLRILDISASGMSVLVPGDQARHLEKGRSVDQISFRIDGKRVSLQAKVTYQAPFQLRELSGIRIGLKFGPVTAETAELISLLMARHLVHYY